MTREDVYDWLMQAGCTQKPFDGINNTANVIKIINPKFPNAEVYLDIPINGKHIPNFAVCKICNDLYVQHPDCVADEIEFVKHLEKKFGDRRHNL